MGSERSASESEHRDEVQGCADPGAQVHADSAEFSSIYDRNAALFEGSEGIHAQARETVDNDTSTTDDHMVTNTAKHAEAIAVSFDEEAHEGVVLPSASIVYSDKDDNDGDISHSSVAEVPSSVKSKFGEQSIGFVTRASDFISTNISVSAGHATMVEDLQGPNLRLYEKGRFF